MPVYGQEDDDFAYQDEHIEMESDNQEHDDLGETEFDSDPALITAAARLPVPPVNLAPKADPVLKLESRAATSVSAPVVKPNASPPQAVPRRPSAAERAPKRGSTSAAQNPSKSQPKGKTASKARSAIKTRPPVGAAGKGAGRSGAKKQTPAQKSRAKTLEKTSVKKAAASKRSFSRSKKSTAKPLNKSKLIRGGTRAKRRSA